MILPCAILFSGNGSNMQNLIEHLHNRTFCTPKKEQITLQIALTLTNNPKAYGIKRAQKLQIPCFILPQSDFPTRTAFDGAMAEILSTHKIAHIFLAGFMRILTPAFTQSFSIINIHPSLLPEHKGAHGIRDSFYSRLPYGGVSVHWVNEELDSGEIIAQEKVAKYPNDTLESFEERIHACEHTLYPRAILQALRLTPCPHTNSPAPNSNTPTAHSTTSKSSPCDSKPSKESKANLKESLEKQPFRHSKHCEETPPESPVTPLFCHSEGAQGATEESLFDSPEVLQVCHSEGGRSPTEESLLSAKDSSTESPERQLFCHSERSEESLKESLVAKRNFSAFAKPQNDNSGRVSSNSKRNFSAAMQAQNDKLTAFTRNPKSNDSQKAHRDSSPPTLPQNDNESNPQDKTTLQGKAPHITNLTYLKALRIRTENPYKGDICIAP